MCSQKAKQLNLKPIAKILYADASQNQVWFTTAPSKALPLALKKAKLTINDIVILNIFSVVGLANINLLINKKLMCMVVLYQWAL